MKLHELHITDISSIGRSHTAAMLASRLHWTMRWNVRKRNMHKSTSKKMRVAYVATFPLHCFNYFCTLTETSQCKRLAHFCLSMYACYVYEHSVALFHCRREASMAAVWDRPIVNVPCFEYEQVVWEVLKMCGGTAEFSLQYFFWWCWDWNMGLCVVRGWGRAGFPLRPPTHLWWDYAFYGG